MRIAVVIILAFALAFTVSCSKNAPPAGTEQTVAPTGNAAPANPETNAMKDPEQTGTQAAGKPQTTCPVMGGPVDKSLYSDYNGRRVYFCCAGCVKTFNENPEKYMQKMERDGILLDKIPKEQ